MDTGLFFLSRKGSFPSFFFVFLYIQVNLSGKVFFLKDANSSVFDGVIRAGGFRHIFMDPTC